MEIKEEVFDIIAKPNAKKTELLGYDNEQNAYRINVKAAPEQGKANLEIIKFFSKNLKIRVKIVKGLTNKRKTLKKIQNF